MRPQYRRHMERWRLQDHPVLHQIQMLLLYTALNCRVPTGFMRTAYGRLRTTLGSSALRRRPLQRPGGHHGDGCGLPKLKMPLCILACMGTWKHI